MYLIDTASVYKNEADIGRSLKVLLPKYNLKRSDIFITSKLGKCTVTTVAQNSPVSI
jgi:diketogulonate reductase-like aldo/keto reductase